MVGLARYEDAPAERLRTASRDAFTCLIDLAVEEKVDFVVIAGDLFDGPWRDVNTGLFFIRQMGRLQRAEIPAYVLYGNHDAESEQTRHLPMPSSVHVFRADKPTTFRLESQRVALHGISFKHRETTRNLVREYPAKVDGWFNIGVLHTALEGDSSHASYAPCSVSELEAMGYDYWALGHVHEHRVVQASVPVVFPGNLQGRSVRELGPRGAMLVEVDDAGSLTLERKYLDVVRWHHLQVDVSAVDDADQALEKCRTELVELIDREAGGHPLAARVSFVGKSAAHADLHLRAHELRAQVVALAASLDEERLWIEKVRAATDPASEETGEAAPGGLAEQLRALMADPELQASIAADLIEMRGRLRQELAANDTVPGLAELQAGSAEALMEAAVPLLLAHLGAGKERAS